MSDKRDIPASVRETFLRIAEEVAIPPASDFISESEADEVLSSKWSELFDRVRSVLSPADLSTEELGQLFAEHLISRGWRVTVDGEGLTVHTEDVVNVPALVKRSLDESPLHSNLSDDERARLAKLVSKAITVVPADGAK